MNEQMARTIHSDKTAQWRQEANDSRLIADSRRNDEDSDDVSLRVRFGRVAIVIAVGLLLLFVLSQYAYLAA